MALVDQGGGRGREQDAVRNPIVLPLAPDALAAPRRAAGSPTLHGRSGGCFLELSLAS